MSERVVSVELNEDDIRELGWVADVLEEGVVDGELTDKEMGDLIGVIRSKLPKAEAGVEAPTAPGAQVSDKNRAFYITFGDGRWFLMGEGWQSEAYSRQLVEVPWESILEPTVWFEGYEVVG